MDTPKSSGDVADEKIDAIKSSVDVADKRIDSTKSSVDVADEEIDVFDFYGYYDVDDIDDHTEDSGWFNSFKEGFRRSPKSLPEKSLPEKIKIRTDEANKDKCSGRWRGAGDSFCRAATYQLALSLKTDAAISYVNASECFSKEYEHKDQALSTLKRAINLYTELDDFNMVAKYSQNIAELYETYFDYNNALRFFEKSVNNYARCCVGRVDIFASDMFKAVLRVAHIAAIIEDYPKSITYFDKYLQCVRVSDSPKSEDYSVNECYLKLGTCYIANRKLNSAKKIFEYCYVLQINFNQTRAGKLLKAIIQYVENDDWECFANAINEYENTSKLDKWMLTILLRIKHMDRSISLDIINNHRYNK
jgi:alpha-soluble NSF attachment protein